MSLSYLHPISSYRQITPDVYLNNLKNQEKKRLRDLRDSIQTNITEPQTKKISYHGKKRDWESFNINHYKTENTKEQSSKEQKTYELCEPPAYDATYEFPSAESIYDPIKLVFL